MLNAVDSEREAGPFQEPPFAACADRPMQAISPYLKEWAIKITRGMMMPHVTPLTHPCAWNSNNFDTSTYVRVCKFCSALQLLLLDFRSVHYTCDHCTLALALALAQGGVCSTVTSLLVVTSFVPFLMVGDLCRCE